jgi:lipoprotein-anchoring transpeptidase ErfK/SrfK
MARSRRSNLPFSDIMHSRLETLHGRLARSSPRCGLLVRKRTLPCASTKGKSNWTFRSQKVPIVAQRVKGAILAVILLMFYRAWEAVLTANRVQSFFDRLGRYWRMRSGADPKVLPNPKPAVGRLLALSRLEGSRLTAVLAMAAMAAGAASALAQSSGGYDPRTWSFDPARNVVIAPSETALRSAYVPQPDVTPIPRELVRFDEPLPAGSIVISTSERRLYYVLGNGDALKYAVGVGKEGLSWSGRDRISDKREWPDWRPPSEMRVREAAKGRILPAHVAGGPNNPLGARALYIGNTLYRIHGTNQPWTVGQATSSGCIRMTNEDVIDLFDRVRIGAEVLVRH